MLVPKAKCFRFFGTVERVPREGEKLHNHLGLTPSLGVQWLHIFTFESELWPKQFKHIVVMMKVSG